MANDNSFQFVHLGMGGWGRALSERGLGARLGSTPATLIWPTWELLSDECVVRKGFLQRGKRSLRSGLL